MGHWGWGLVAATAIAAGPAQAKPLDGPMTVLRGVVGKEVSVALPTREGYRWDWEAGATERPFGPPYRVRFNVSEGLGPEVWTFPLFKTGKVTLTFTMRPITMPPRPSQPGPPAGSDLQHVVQLVVLTPYEAQQRAPSEMRDTLLLK